jgi:hypothetical protein
MLLDGQRITANGLQGAFRPLFPGLISLLLTVTGRNLLAALAVMVALTALATYLAAACLAEEYGPLPAALFFASVFAFIRPLLGDTLTEVPSLAFACLALVLLFRVARTRSRADAAWGGVLLILAISIRAGAFFMLPFLLLWLGWLFRGNKKFSWRAFITFSLIFMIAFGLFNVVLPGAITEKSGSTFGNFSWMLYGQAVGGAGFQYHLQALGTDDSTVVLQAALQKIRDYPMGLMIGFYKSYRDFFTNNSSGMFDLLSGGKAAGGWIFWMLCMAGLIYGLIRSCLGRKENRNGMLLASFLGILLSIPFLPPVDGGNRFYSGSVPFLFALMVVNLPALRIRKNAEEQISANSSVDQGLCWTAGVITALMVIGPMVVLGLSRPVGASLPNCSGDQIPFVARFQPGSYVDILPDDSAVCGISPKVCLTQFSGSGMDRENDDFYNNLVQISENSPSGIRLWAGMDYGSRQYYFFLLPLDVQREAIAGHLFQGCAEKVQTQYQNVLQIVTID